MRTSQQRIFFTGASGTMGRAGLDVLLERRDKFEVVTLVPPTHADRRIMRPYLQQGVKVIWGDLARYEDVLAG